MTTRFPCSGDALNLTGKERPVQRGSLAAPERLQLCKCFDGAVQLTGNLLQGEAALAPEFAVQANEKFKDRKAKDQKQQPGQDCHRLVPRTVSQVIVLRQFVERVVFHPPALVTDPPDDLGPVAAQAFTDQPAPVAGAGLLEATV